MKHIVTSVSLLTISKLMVKTTMTNIICRKWVINIILKYSKHPNTEPSGIRMVIPRTQFVSDYRMVRFSNGRDRTYLSGFQMVVKKLLV